MQRNSEIHKIIAHNNNHTYGRKRENNFISTLAYNSTKYCSIFLPIFYEHVNAWREPWKSKHENNAASKLLKENLQISLVSAGLSSALPYTCCLGKEENVLLKWRCFNVFLFFFQKGTLYYLQPTSRFGNSVGGDDTVY